MAPLRRPREPESLRGRKKSTEYFTIEMGIKSLNRFGVWFFFFLSMKLLMASFNEILIALGSFSTRTFCDASIGEGYVQRWFWGLKGLKKVS